MDDRYSAVILAMGRLHLVWILRFKTLILEKFRVSVAGGINSLASLVCAVDNSSIVGTTQNAGNLFAIATSPISFHLMIVWQ